MHFIFLWGDFHMKKIFFILFVAFLCTSCAVGSSVMGRQKTVETVQLYCVDSDLYKLIPYDVEIEAASAQEAAEHIIDKLINGMQYEKIRHIIPAVENGVTVRIEGDTAFVNFSDEMVQMHPDDIDSEYLTVYSVVNSLASLEAVTAVRFTIGGEQREKFKGFLDMRETFLPDYMV